MELSKKQDTGSNTATDAIGTPLGVEGQIRVPRPLPPTYVTHRA